MLFINIFEGKVMRKFAVVVLVSALAIMLAVCSSTDSSGPTVTPVPTSTPEPTPTATPTPTPAPTSTPVPAYPANYGY